MLKCQEGFDGRYVTLNELNVLDRFLQLEGVTSPVERGLFCNCDSSDSAICDGFGYSA